MAGMNMLGRSGGATISQIMAVPSTPQAAPAAVVAYGPGASTVQNAGPGLLNGQPGSVAVYIGAGALALLLYGRHQHTNKRDFDQDIFSIVLVVLALRGAVIDAKRRVLEGKTSGVTGTAAQAVALL
jgi:hypothetical protein